ncbi:MAG: guanine deaminase [Phycisphaerales bacterium]|nr:MAG: guanine deaminase [Phycisphaerales bacterium]
MIAAGRLMLPNGTDAVRLADAWLRIENDRIAEVGEGPPPVEPDLGGPTSYVLPGFVDAHCHLPQFDAIGADGMELLDWLAAVIFPAETRWQDATYARDMADRVASRLLTAGTTACACFATVHAEATQAAIETLAARGLRAHVGHVLMDRHAPRALTPPIAAQVESSRQLRPAGRAEVSVAPRFAISCTPELLAAAGELAAKTGRLVQTHLSENRAEVALARELFPGRSYTQVYDDFGLLSERAVLAHGVWLDDDERSLLAERGAIVAHCPTANAFLMSGDADVRTMRAAGVRVALGSDIAGGPIVSMPRVARHMLETSKRLHGRDGVIPPERLWRQITAGNADALGWPRTSRLEPGAEADLLIIEPDACERLARDRWPNELGYLLHAWQDRWIRRVVVAGRVQP